MTNLDAGRIVGIISPIGNSDTEERALVPFSDSGTVPTEDAALVRGLRSDNQRALGELMERYWEPLVGFAHRVLSGVGDPEGMVQTSFVRLWNRRRELSPEGSLRALLYTIVRNACLDELRRDRRRQKADEGADAPASPRTPYEDVQGAELQRLAAAAVSRLPERRREVFRLAREEGLSYQEIADILGLSTQTVANHMSLALADLRAALRPHIAQGLPGPASTQGSRDLDSEQEQMDG